MILARIQEYDTSSRVVIVGKISAGERDRVAIAHQHKIGYLVQYLEIQ